MKLSGVKARVLIVDDNIETRNAIRMALEYEPYLAYAFTESGSVASGLSAVDNWKPDVIILDIHMPGENGFDFLDKLDEQRASKKNNVLVLTADDTLKNIWQVQSKGIDAYRFMGKPFESEELRAQVLGIALDKLPK